MTQCAERLGFVGLGLMGHGMAHNILTKGHPLAVLAHRRREAVEDLLSKGATEAPSLAALAEASDRLRALVRKAGPPPALADAVLLAVSERLAPRFAVKAGVSSEQLLQVQGMTLERYAALGHLLEPFGAQLQRVEGDRIVYRVNGSSEQLRSQLSLAKLQEVPAGEALAPQPVPSPVAEGAQPVPVPQAEPEPQLRFRW